MSIKSREIVGDQKIGVFLFDKRSDERAQFLLFIVQFTITKVLLDEPGEAEDGCYCLGFFCAYVFEASIVYCIWRSLFSSGQKCQCYGTSLF